MLRFFRFFQPIKPLLKGWVLSFAVFALLAFLVVGQFALAISMPWREAMRMAVRDWMQWALVAPLVFRLVSRLPLERERWKLGLPIHLLAAIATVVFCNWWNGTVFPPPPREHDGWRHRAEGAPGSHGAHNLDGPRQAGDARPALAAPPDGARKLEGGPPALPPGAPPHRQWHGPPLHHGPEPTGWRYAFRSLFNVGFRLPIYLAVLSAAHAGYFYRRSKDRERRSLELEGSLAQSRLDALKMQLQPHFLFNALNSIAELVHKDANAADEMLGALSDLLRLTLETTGQQELPLRRELEFVESYLAIEHIRFGDRLRFEFRIAPDTRDALVPTFLLQPLVENAVRHGLEPRAGPGMLTITSARDGAALHLRVADNGRGLAPDAPVREGVGISNTRARLRELYGALGALHMRASDGMEVEIVLPFHESR